MFLVHSDNHKNASGHHSHPSDTEFGLSVVGCLVEREYVEWGCVSTTVLAVICGTFPT